MAFTTERAGVRSIEKILITNAGANYTSPPIITFSGGGGTGAAATCSVETSAKGVIRFTMTDNGIGFGTAPVVTIANPETISGVGTYQFNEVVQGMRSGTQARVKSWDVDTGILQVGNIGIGTTTTGFFAGEDIKGLTSGALFSVSNFDDDTDDKYNEGDIFESEADLIIDFSESNPFGSF